MRPRAIRELFYCTRDNIFTNCAQQQFNCGFHEYYNRF